MPAIDPGLKQLYAAALQRPETREILDYLTARGVDPRSSQRTVPMPMQASDRPMITVDELVYDLTQRAGHEIRMQRKEQPASKLADAVRKMEAGPQSPGLVSGATDMRVLLDLALREQRANPEAQMRATPYPKKKAGML